MLATPMRPPTTAMAIPMPSPRSGAMVMTLIIPAMLSSILAPVSNQIMGQMMVSVKFLNILKDRGLQTMFLMRLMKVLMTYSTSKGSPEVKVVFKDLTIVLIWSLT